MRVEIVKCHGSGNDFVLVDCITNTVGLSEEDFVGFTKYVCDREGVIGADGTLFLLPSSVADVRMRIFNADGSEPEMCGNGIRCLARKAFEITGEDTILVETMRSNLYCYREEDIFEGVASDSVLIDSVSFKTGELNIEYGDKFVGRVIPGLSPDLGFSFINLGNPHIVSNASVDDVVLEGLGRRANTDKQLFPKGVNVSVFDKISDQELYVRTYERGVGLTSSCGTAMASSCIAACLLGVCRFGEWIDVFNKGGMVRCLADDKDGAFSVKLLGNATFVFTASVEYPEPASGQEIEEDVNTREVDAYQNFMDYCANYRNS